MRGEAHRCSRGDMLPSGLRSVLYQRYGISQTLDMSNPGTNKPLTLWKLNNEERSLAGSPDTNIHNVR